MKNPIICKTCGSENPFYNLTCINCKAYLRERIFNIDLWNIISLLIESPKAAFRTIIFSEHKNFIFFLLVFICGKFFVFSILFSKLLLNKETLGGNFLIKYFYLLLIITCIIFFFALLYTKLLKFLDYSTRLKDNFSILVYSLIPYVFGIIILFPIELIIFGENLFSNNPSPFVIKEFFGEALLNRLITSFQSIAYFYRH